jgi:hypothetical protein
MKRAIFSVLVISIGLLLKSCDTTEPPPPPPDGDKIKNTIAITTLWQDLNKIAVNFTRSQLDTNGTFTYKLKRKNPTGSETQFLFMLIGTDTTFIDANLERGTQYIYKVEAEEKQDKTKDTSRTIYVTTLDTTSHNITWQMDTLGQPGDFLYDVWGLDENNVWAVGAVHMQQGVTSVIKWDGVRWNYHSWPEGGARAIWGFSANDFWTVGDYSNRGFIGHFNGTNWTEYRSEYFLARGDTVYPLYSVWGSSPDDVWAVGDQGKIIHWDGSEWLKVQSPINLILYDIWGTSTESIYAIHISLSQQSQLIHYEGNSWTNITNQLPTGERNFTSLWFDKGGTGYIVGNNVLFYDGGAFNRIEINQDKFLLRVRGRNSTDVFTVGQKGRVHHFNGTNWMTYPELFDESPGMELRGVYVTETTVFAVGIINNGSIIYRGVRQ